MSDELKPCPFCGSAAELLEMSDPAPAELPEIAYCYTIRCSGDNCPIEPTTGDVDTQPQAVKIWNRRAAPLPAVPAPPCPACGNIHTGLDDQISFAALRPFIDVNDADDNALACVLGRVRKGEEEGNEVE